MRLRRSSKSRSADSLLPGAYSGSMPRLLRFYIREAHRGGWLRALKYLGSRYCSLGRYTDEAFEFIEIRFAQVNEAIKSLLSTEATPIVEQPAEAVVETKEPVIDYYESVGWFVGKNKMKSWRHSVSGWIARTKIDVWRSKLGSKYTFLKALPERPSPQTILSCSGRNSVITK